MLEALRRVATVVPLERAEAARAAMLELFPEGFEELDLDTAIELVAYTDAAGEAGVRAVFGDVTASDVEVDWAERWRAFHRGFQVGPLWVGPPWDRGPGGVLAVVIEPGRAFGTGSHPTTRLCLELLWPLPRGSLLDVGCGSGVLAVAGARLGFAPVHAVDHDADAVAATIANAAANDVEVEVRELDALAGELPEAETTVANLTLEGVCALAPRIRSACLVTSGYLATDRLVLSGRTSQRRVELDGWAADVWIPAQE